MTLVSSVASPVISSSMPAIGTHQNTHSSENEHMNHSHAEEHTQRGRERARSIP